MLIDSDILLDVALNRVPHSIPASELQNILANSGNGAFIAWHSVSNLYYVLRRSRGDSRARQFIAELLEFVSVAETTTDDVLYAASLPMSDFEDAMQVAAARACGASHIVTRNARDYVRSPVPAVDAEEAVRLLG